jgi:hypothetical protein
VENWYGTVINQNSRHRELLEAAEKERLAKKCAAESESGFRVQRLADLAVLVGIALMALRGAMPKRQRKQSTQPQTPPTATPRSVNA